MIMKLKPLVITACILSAGLLGSFFILCVLSLSACKKNDTGGNPCGTNGGITQPNTYLFYIDHDFSCGQVNVEVKDADGKTVTPYNGVISYTSPTPPSCNNTSYGRFATFDLYQGKNYTYKASCSGKTWAGTITVPCEQGQCKTILLQ
jgi:hypothetical protein